nr:tetratricopeptide repeat protein [Bacteroidales bacterium]
KFIFFIVFGICIYSNSFTTPFYLDDQHNISNPSLRVESFSFENVLKAGFEGTLKSRPISNISFSFNYLLGGYNVIGFHIFNIIIHIFSAIFLYLLLQTTLNLPANIEKYGRYSYLPFFTALIWLAHPLATQSVTYIVQRMNSMAAMFFVLSVLFYAKGRIKQIEGRNNFSFFSPLILFLGSLLSGLLALGSKEIAATLPVVIVLYEWFFFQDLSWNWLQRKAYWFLGAVASLAAMAYLYTDGNPIQRIFSSCSGFRDFTTWERVLTQFRVVVHYIGLIIYPHPERLTFDYDFSVSKSLIDPITTLASLGILLGLFICAILFARRERLLSFCIFWFLINLVMESSFICLEMVFEHRTYLPSMFFILLVAAVISRVVQNKTILTIFFTSLIIILGIWTYERNKVWQDPLTFWNDSLQKSPEKPRVLINTGNVYFNNKDYDRAEFYYKKAHSIDSEHKVAHNNLISLYLTINQQEEAEKYIKRGLQLAPNWVDLLNALASIHVDRKKYKEAIHLFRTSLHVSPLYHKSNYHMGKTLLRTERPKLAIYFLIQAAASQPENIPYLLDLARAYKISAQVPKAINIYEKILLLDPNHVIAHSNLGLLLTGYDNELARSHYEQVVQLSPNSVPDLYNLANMLFREGENDNAKEYYERVISITPELANCYNNLGLLLAKEGNTEDAITLFKRALQILPGHRLALSNLAAAEKEKITHKQQYN